MEMEKLVSLCKRRGYLFQSSEIYGGLNGFWDYGPLGVELKRNVKDAWWRDMVRAHDDLTQLPGTPSPYAMTGLDCTIIMHPQVWKVSGHYDLFHDFMQTCHHCKKLFRVDHIPGMLPESDWVASLAKMCKFNLDDKTIDVTPDAIERWGRKKGKNVAPGLALIRDPEIVLGALAQRQKDHPETPLSLEELLRYLAFSATGPQLPCPACGGELTEPREFNLMFETHTGAIRNDDNKVFLRPETAQGIFVNFKNVLDSTRIRVPFGIAQIGKSFRNEITPRNFTFRSREFEQMEIEFFCHPDSSQKWYQYWRDRRFAWYKELGLSDERLQLRDHDPDELSHYSTGTADIEYAFPFLAEGEFGELEGVAHRGNFDLRSHMEGKLDPATNPLEVEKNEHGQPVHRGSGKDLSYRDDLTGERFIPHVIEPSAGADRATLAFLCEAYCEDEAPNEKGEMMKRVVLRLHPRLAPIKAAIFPLVKKDGMPDIARDIYRAMKPHFNVFYDEKGAIGRRYRRQDEAGTPYCITIDGDTLKDKTVTIRDRDTLEQWRVKLDDCVEEIRQKLQ